LGGGALLKDDFSTSGVWGTSTDSHSLIEYADGVLWMQAFTNNYFIWSTPQAESYEKVQIEVTAYTRDTSYNTAFGILCHQQTLEDSFYYLVMTPAGEYAIAETSLIQSDVFLTNNDQWATFDTYPVKARSYRLGADCGNGKLTLYVDRQQIASVSDDTYTAGNVGLVTWSGEDELFADVSFDNFVVTKLK